MKGHPGEERLVHYVLGDEPNRDETESHLRICPECRREVATLERLLRATGEQPVPEPDAGFEARIWERQRAALVEAGRLSPGASVSAGRESGSVVRPPVWTFRRVVAAAAIAASVALAFLIGLYTPPPGSDPAPPVPGAADRVLRAAVGDHFERAGAVLREVSNARSETELADSRERAQRLVTDNRLYRQTARLGGHVALTGVLEELERVLLELARAPEVGEAGQLEWLRRRIEDRDLLFKLKVLEGTTREGAGFARTAGRDL